MGGKKRIVVVFSTLKDLEEVEKVSKKLLGPFKGSFFNQSWKSFLGWVKRHGVKSGNNVSALFIDETQVLRFEKKSSARVLEELWEKSI